MKWLAYAVLVTLWATLWYGVGCVLVLFIRRFQWR